MYLVFGGWWVNVPCLARGNCSKDRQERVEGKRRVKSSVDGLRWTLWMARGERWYTIRRRLSFLAKPQPQS